MEGAHKLESACSPIPKGKEPTHARLKDTFLTTLYVIVDDFCHSHRPKNGPDRRLPSPKAKSLPSPSSRPLLPVLTSESDFYRYA